MKENKLAILTSDWHIRADTPKCRIDDFFSEQWKKIKFILSLAKNNNCPIIIAGDIGDKPRWPNWLLRHTIDIFNKYNVEIICIPGQHDLPNHSLDKYDESAMAVLEAACVIKVLTPNKEKDYQQIYTTKIKEQEINIIHTLITDTQKNLIEYAGANKASDVLKTTAKQIILSGDNHKTFYCVQNNKLLINSGSIMRMNVNQITHKPSIFLWYGKDIIKQIPLPISPGTEVIDMSYVEIENERKNRYEAFCKRLKNNSGIETLCFKKHLDLFMENNKKEINEEIKKIIYQCID